MFDYQKAPDFDEGPEGERQWRAWHEEFTGELTRVAGHLNAMEYYFVKLLSRYDQHECWAGEGVKSFAHWLNWKCGINMLVAREKVRVARCLRVLPMIDDAFRTGRISYSKTRALTRAATPENESLLLKEALELTTEHVEQLVRRYKKAPVPGEYTSYYAEAKQPYVVCHRDEDGMVQLHARLPIEEGLLVEKALEKMTNHMRQDAAIRPRESDSAVVDREAEADVDAKAKTKSKAEATANEVLLTETETKESGLQTKKVSAETSRGDCGWYRFGRERARALVQIAEHYLGDGHQESDYNHIGDNSADDNDGNSKKTLSGADKYHVVIHVNANDAHRDCRINNGACTYTEGGMFLAPHVAKMLACDASRTTVVEDDKGSVLNIGRRSRTVPRAIELAVDIRDNYTCQYPNCHQRHHTDKHHIITWAGGGETSVKNLITLCRFHHVQQHEGKYHIERIDDDHNNDHENDTDDENNKDSYHFLFISRHGEVIRRGMDPQFPAGSGVETVVPLAELDSPAAPEHRRSNGKQLGALEARMERNRLSLEFYRGINMVTQA